MPPFPKLRVAALDDLARQVRFAPVETLRRQLERCEALAGEVDPAINYPEDWIVFRITGYRPEIAAPATVVGEALIADISGLVERLSAAAKVTAKELEPGKWLDAEGVCRRWAISRKTLERWRRFGLIARRVRGENGKPRLAFPLAAVERFERERKASIEGAAGFSRLGDALEARIARRAAAYAHLGCSLNQAAARIAARYGRALETVRQAIKRSESRALFDDRGPPTARERRLIERAWWLGIEPRDLAKRLKRSTASVVRVVNDERARRLREVLSDKDQHESSPQGRSGTPRSERQAAPAPSLKKAAPLEEETVVSGLGALGETDLLRFVVAAKHGEVALGVVERARARAYRALMARARDAARALPRRGASGAAVDAIETDLRWAMRLKAELIRSQFPLLLRSIEAALMRPVEEIRSGLLTALVREGVAAIGEAVDGFDPDKGGRLAAPTGIALQRIATKVLREHAVELAAGQGRAVPRLQEGVWIGDWTRRVSASQSWEGRAWLEPPARVRRGAAAIDPRLRRVLELRYGWGPRPMTIAELAADLKIPAMRAAVVERRAAREASRAAGDRHTA